MWCLTEVMMMAIGETETSVTIMIAAGITRNVATVMGIVERFRV